MQRCFSILSISPLSFHYQWAELNPCTWRKEILHSNSAEIQAYMHSRLFFFFRFFCSSPSHISDIFFLLNRIQIFTFSPSSSFLLASLPTPNTEPAFVCFTLNQHSFIKKLLISLSVVQSTDYCDNCKTFRAFSPPTLCWQTIGLRNSTTRNAGSSLFQHT